MLVRSGGVLRPLLRLSILAAVLVLTGTAARPSLAAPTLPCEDKNWPFSTRTFPEICPELIWEDTREPGLAGAWSIGFGPDNALYFTRPVTAEILRMAYREDGWFEPPQPYAPLSDAYEWAWRLGLVERDKPISGVLARSPKDGIWWHSEAGGMIRAQDGRVIQLEKNSAPMGIAFYTGDAFPAFRGNLLVVTSGSWNAQTIEGYQLLIISFDEKGNPGATVSLIPANTYNRTNADAALIHLNFFPEHPVSVTVDHNGWIYVVLREGRIIRLRPRPA